MGFFTKKNFLYKMIICFCIVFAIMNSSSLPKVYAADESGGIGGMLMSPICDLLLGLGDGVMNMLQKAIMGTEATLVVDNSDNSFWEDLGAWLIVIALVALAVVLTVVTCGGFTAALAAMAPVLIKGAIAVVALHILTAGNIWAVASAVSSALLSDDVVLPTYTIGPEEIFSGRILLFDANVFVPKNIKVDIEHVIEGGGSVEREYNVRLDVWESRKGKPPYDDWTPIAYYFEESPGVWVPTSLNQSSYELRDIIAKWYYIIRTIALIGSMLILLYIGIRIIISSIAEEKAKYKQMLADWVIALCLIFMMHYIMVFAHSIVESITKMLNHTMDGDTQMAVIDGGSEGLNDHLIENIKSIGSAQGNEYLYLDKDTENTIYWPTNQMGRLRVKAQAKDGSGQYIGYAVANIVLVIYTFVFSVTYIKRLIYLLFLTCIAPLVALTYPIDKIHDGKAQAFNMWLKEYIFNLAIQPFHLILYTIFVAMAFEMSSTNIIYTLVVLGFMMPAEKFLRNMFGFNKASTPGMLGGAAGAAVAMSAVSALGKWAKGDKKDGNNKQHDKGSGKEDPGKIRTADSRHSQQSLYEGLADGKNKEGESAGEDNKQPELSEEEKREKQRQRALDKYNSEGGNQNAEGHYYNFGIDEYDEDYDPTKDKQYLETEEDNQNGTNLDTREEENAPNEFDGANTPQLDSSEESNASKPKKDGMIRRALRAEGRAIRRRLPTGGWKGYAKAAGRTTLKAAKGTAKIAAKIGAGVAFGAVGLAAGIASGDPSKAFQNTVAGASAGVAVSSGIINRLPKSNPNAKEQWKKDYYGEDYKDEQRKKQDEEFASDPDIRAMYKEQLGIKSRKELNTVMDEANQYRAYGVNDNSIIIKAMKSKKASSDKRDDRERIAAAKLAENSKTEKDLQTNMKRFKDVPGMSEKQAKKMEDFVREINNL